MIIVEYVRTESFTRAPLHAGHREHSRRCGEASRHTRGRNRAPSGVRRAWCVAQLDAAVLILRIEVVLWGHAQVLTQKPRRMSERDSTPKAGEAAREAIRGLAFKIPLPVPAVPVFRFKSEV